MSYRSSPQTSRPARLYLLGSFRIELDTQAVELPTHKSESLLAYVALHPRPHAREKLAALLWGDAPDDAARNSLRNAVSHLRKQLGQELLLADRESIQLNPDYELWVDAIEFESQPANPSPNPHPNPAP